MVTAVLPPSANVGDRIDAAVSSIGDARSLAGGTLIMTPLIGPDQRTYALAQGPLLTGGYRYDSDLNNQQRNTPTSAILQGGATIETPVESPVLARDGELSFLLARPDFSTAQRVAAEIGGRLGQGSAWARGADEVRIRFGGGPVEVTAFIASLENILVEPGRAPARRDQRAHRHRGRGRRRDDLERGDRQGDIKVTVTAQRTASQPSFVSGFASDVGSLVVTNTRLEVDQVGDRAFAMPNTSVADLVQALSRARIDTRRMISILQAIQAAGALHAEIVVQ